MGTIAWPIQVQPSLQWETLPKFCPVSLSLSMAATMEQCVLDTNAEKQLS
jgi:hypothetical protein